MVKNKGNKSYEFKKGIKSQDLKKELNHVVQKRN